MTTARREAVLAAAKAAASELHREEPRILEADLVLAVERNLMGSLKREHRSDPVLGWKRQPGGVDLAILEDGRATTLMEMKCDDLDQCLWDVFKLASLRRHPHITDSYLVYEATTERFESDYDCARLFRGEGPEPYETVDLIRRWPRAWADLLNGGYGNHPAEAVAHVTLQLHGPFEVEATRGREVRVLEIECVGEDLVRFDDDGWPEQLPQGDRVETRRLSPEAKQGAPADERLGPGMTGLPKRITQPWLETNVPTMSDDEFGTLVTVLRGKGWTQAELSARVLPLRPAASPDEAIAESLPSDAAIAAEGAAIGAADAASEAAGRVSQVPTGSSDLDLPDLVERVLPAVVQVVTVRRKPIGSGSGFAIASLKGDEENLTTFITNAHVTLAATSFTFGGERTRSTGRTSSSRITTTT